MREHHAGRGRRELRDLLPPREMVAAEAVREDQRRTLPCGFVIDLGAVCAAQPSAFPQGLRFQNFALTAPLGARPFTISAAWAAVSIDWCSIAGTVSPAACGVAITSLRAARRGVGIWSGARPTSIAQPARCPASSAASTAASSTRLPRDTLTRYAPFFICPIVFRLIRFSVSAVATASGTT